MAPGLEETMSKMKFSSKEEHPAGASHGQGGLHGQEEGKAGATHSPVLIEQPGAAQSSKIDGSGLRVVIVAARWYKKVVHSLVDACSEELLAKGVADDDLHLVEVAGAFELPFAAARLVHCKDTSHRPDAVICIGCLVNDDTHMCETMGHAVANGIMKLNVTSGIPIIYGVLCCDSESQAHSCAEKLSCGGGEGQKCNHGVSWAQSALEMAHLKRCTLADKGKHCSCTRCVNRGSKHKSDEQESSKQDLCTSCDASGKECTCKNCKCRVCCNHRGDCTSCKSSAGNCSCTDCKCPSCCAKRDLCRGCGCPPDKCSCKGCNCVACSSKKGTAGTKMPPSEHARTQQTSERTPTQQTSERTPTQQSSEHAPMQQTRSSSEYPSKQATSTSSGGVKHGGSTECASCGSPGGQCKCGLLH